MLLQFVLLAFRSFSLYGWPELAKGFRFEACEILCTLFHCPCLPPPHPQVLVGSTGKSIQGTRETKLLDKFEILSSLVCKGIEFHSNAGGGEIFGIPALNILTRSAQIFTP